MFRKKKNFLHAVNVFELVDLCLWPLNSNSIVKWFAALEYKIWYESSVKQIYLEQFNKKIK